MNENISFVGFDLVYIALQHHLMRHRVRNLCQVSC